jgi:hypothetical protein
MGLDEWFALLAIVEQGTFVRDADFSAIWLTCNCLHLICGNFLGSYTRSPRGASIQPMQAVRTE